MAHTFRTFYGGGWTDDLSGRSGGAGGKRIGRGRGGRGGGSNTQNGTIVYQVVVLSVILLNPIFRSVTKGARWRWVRVFLSKYCTTVSTSIFSNVVFRGTKVRKMLFDISRKSVDRYLLPIESSRKNPWPVSRTTNWFQSGGRSTEQFLIEIEQLNKITEQNHNWPKIYWTNFRFPKSLLTWRSIKQLTIDQTQTDQITN